MSEESQKFNITPFIIFVLVATAAFLAGRESMRGSGAGGANLGSNAGNSPSVLSAPTPLPERVISSEEFSEIKNGELAKGKADAPVTVVEFSDFQCPACGGAYPAIKQILDTYGDKIRLIFRHFPLTNIHPLAKPAALASYCAFEQNKFWEYHDLVFEKQTELSENNLKQWAKDLGLNTSAFNTCLDSQRYKSKVEADMALGNKVQVGGTPTFFVNGKEVNWISNNEGWQNALKRYIEAALGS